MPTMGPKVFLAYDAHWKRGRRRGDWRHGDGTKSRRKIFDFNRSIKSRPTVQHLKFRHPRFKSGMAKTRSMTRNHNHDDDDAFIRKRIKTWDNDSVAPWSDLSHDLLFLVMMELGVVDFLSFSRVCKSWRSFALPNKIRFMASKPPMELLISEGSDKTYEYSLLDFGGRSIKIILPESSGRTCVALTCGYLVLYGRKSCDFLLMNPITRHGIRFPPLPDHRYRPFFSSNGGFRAILVFSPSRSAWVFVVLCRYTYTCKIWFSIAGKGEWGYVSSNYGITDLHEFKGKIYAIDIHSCLFELRLDLEPKLMLLNTKNAQGRNLMPLQFVSSSENLYVMDHLIWYDYKVQKLDFGEMKWVSVEENSTKDYAFFVSELRHSAAAIKPGLWSESNSWLCYKVRRSTTREISGNILFLKTGIWYFPHDCLKVNFKHE